MGVVFSPKSKTERNQAVAWKKMGLAEVSAIGQNETHPGAQRGSLFQIKIFQFVEMWRG